MSNRPAATDSVKTKRQTLKYKHANPLFDSWLREWHDQAKQADSNMRFNLAKARKSLSLFPLPVYCGADCKVLQYFGDKVCSMIDRRLVQHEQQFGPIDWDQHIQVVKGKVRRQSIARQKHLSTSSSKITPTTNPSSLPLPGKQPHLSPLSVQPSSKPLVKRKKTSHLGLNSTPTTALLPAIHLPASGDEEPPLAKRRKKARVSKVSQNRATVETVGGAALSSAAAAPSAAGRNFIGDSASSTDLTSNLSSESTTAHDVMFTLQPGSYEVLLCVDLAETISKSSKEGIVRELRQHGLQHHVRKLHVGDFAWVAQERGREGGQQGSPREVLLPYLVERKRMDDLASSIKDGRCREQKHRLLQCGVDTIIYLVEEAGGKHAGLPLSTCHQAVANTSVVDRLLVKWTADYRETAAHLTLMTRLIQSTYQGRALHAIAALSSPLPPGGCFLPEFSSFNSSAVKNRQLTVQEMLAKHLLQVAGLSVQKVAAIVQEVPTLSSLVSLLSTSEGVTRLAGLKTARSTRCVGQQAAAALQALYTRRVLQ